MMELVFYGVLPEQKITLLTTCNTILRKLPRLTSQSDVHQTEILDTWMWQPIFWGKLNSRWVCWAASSL